MVFYHCALCLGIKCECRAPLPISGFKTELFHIAVVGRSNLNFHVPVGRFKFGRKVACGEHS